MKHIRKGVFEAITCPDGLLGGASLADICGEHAQFFCPSVNDIA